MNLLYKVIKISAMSRGIEMDNTQSLILSIITFIILFFIVFRGELTCFYSREISVNIHAFSMVSKIGKAEF